MHYIILVWRLFGVARNCKYVSEFRVHRIDDQKSNLETNIQCLQINQPNPLTPVLKLHQLPPPQLYNHGTSP